MPKSRLPTLRALLSLLSSMRFAVSLLAVLAIASVIGTVLRQNEAPVAYVVEFGSFWHDLFESAGLFDIYHSAVFLLILLFLLISVSLCIWRHSPALIRDLKSWREQAAPDSLRAMPCHREFEFACEPEVVQSLLLAHGFKVRQKETAGVWLIVGRKGRFNKLGYLFAHAAIVVICIGGLLDGNLPLKLQELGGFKLAEVRDLPQSQIPGISRLTADNHAFRGSVTIPEGGVADVVFLNTAKGYYVQELPFAIKLKRFSVEHYATGQPKNFTSSVELLDRTSGKVLRQAQIEVNKPLRHAGIAIYQASFGDGGSPLTLAQYSLSQFSTPTELSARSQNTTPLNWQGRLYKLELGDFRLFNIEQTPNQTDRPSGLAAALTRSHAVQAENHSRNMGPSLQFKLRDDAGQAVEFLNYLAPFSEEGGLYLLTGSRSDPNSPFSFTRIPLDQSGTPDNFLRLRDVLLDKTLHPEIARRTVAKAESGGGITPQAREQFRAIVLGALEQFASGGFPAIDRFLDAKVPQAQRQAVAQTYIKVLQGAVIDAMDIARGKAGLPLLPVSEAQYRFLLDSLVASSSLIDYGAPFWLHLTSFEEIKASGLQLTRAPGQPIVYLGMVLLVIGVFCMFYIREVRCWVRITSQGSLLAMTANRKNSDLAREFEQIASALTGKTDHD